MFNTRRILFAVWISVFVFFSSAFPQITIRLLKVPKGTPASDSIFIGGTFNKWNPRDPAFRLMPQRDGSYAITFNPSVADFEYKFSRGDWSSVEGGENGIGMLNRTFHYNGSAVKIEAAVQSWIDLEKINNKIPAKDLKRTWITIRALKIPKNTPVNDSVFVGGSFNNWDPEDPNFRLLPQSDGSYAVTFRPILRYFEFKFTHGSWAGVEGDQNGQTISNRIFEAKGSSDTANLIIQSWTDLETIKITVTEIPPNSPDNSPVYITGPFNKWNPADPDYKLERLDNGNYQMVLHHLDTLSFKFTRGSFESIEVGKNGQPLASRLLIPSSIESKEIQYRIDGWEDLSESKTDFYTIILMLAAFMSAFIAIGFSMIRNPKKEANAFLIIFLILISAMLAVRILLNDQYFVYQAPRLFLFPLFLLFTLNPLLYIYAKNVLQPYSIVAGVKEYLLFMGPIVALLVVSLPYITTDKDQLVLLLLNGELDNQLVIISAIGILYNFNYLPKYFKLLRNKEAGEGISGRYYFIASLVLTGATIMLIFITAQFVFLGLFGSSGKQSLMDVCFRLCWLGLCLYPLIVIWFNIQCPEIFNTAFEPDDKDKSNEGLNVAKIKLDELMESKKPFLNPDLTLNDLAKLLQSNTSTVSKIINEANSNNFYDFINNYRIAEFKKRIEMGQHKTKTILAIATETGFKSKSTFNRSFKRINGITPKEYLATVKIEH